MAQVTHSFDDFLATDRQADIIDQPPFQHREDKSEKATLEWLVQNFDNAERAAHSRNIVYRRYQALYKGIHWRYFDTRDSRRDMEYTSRKPRQVANFIHEMIEAKVSQMSRLKSNITLIPAHDEQSDINNAKTCKLLHDARAEEIDLEKIHQNGDRVKFLFGHAFTWVTWDKDQGPLLPAYERAKEQYGDKIPKINKKTGKVVKGKYIHEEVRAGDVCVEILGPDRCYVELNKKTWAEIDHVDRIDWFHKEQLHQEYPGKKEDILDNKRDIYDYDSAELVRPRNQIMVRTFYHKPTKWLPKGAMIKYTDDVILEWNDFPYEDSQLPCVPDTDIDVYGEFWGRSFINNIEQQQRFYNNLQSATARDHGIGSAPKWMMPKGACNVSSLNNEFTIVEFTGPTAPQLVQSTPTSPQTFQLMDMLEGQMTKFSQVYDISRGDVPTGVTANSALRFLDEQESQRVAPQEMKRKRKVIATAKMMLCRMKQYYKADDGRTVRLLGPNNEYLIKDMKKADFKRVYDVKLQNTSALPDSKGGKIAAIIDLNTATQTDPVFRKEEIIKMLDLGNDDFFKDKATVSVDAAKTNLQRLLDGDSIPEPKAFDDLLVHFSVFDKAMQETTFKTIDEPTQAAIFRYVKILEMLMHERARKNMKFAMELAELDNFPMFYTPDQPIQALIAMHQMAAQGLMAPPPAGKSGAADTSKVEKIPKQQGDEGNANE